MFPLIAQRNIPQVSQNLRRTDEKWHGKTHAFAGKRKNETHKTRSSDEQKHCSTLRGVVHISHHQLSQIFLCVFFSFGVAFVCFHWRFLVVPLVTEHAR